MNQKNYEKVDFMVFVRARVLYVGHGMPDGSYLAALITRS
ncbi:hypothetical protein NIES4073_66490 [Kalymmatonema gypsitolerans NIES-4073]|nr:hypothetical protein NIES4073_66490 [Scytonema sp. NIES-4073]